MFWGLIMEPGRCYTQTVKVSFHVSMAALDISTSSDEPAQVMCVFEGRNYLLCTLNKKEQIQCSLDLNFEAGSKVSFATNGKSHVHLTGYLTIFEDDEAEEGEEEEEEETEAAIEKKRPKRKAVEGPPAKKAKNNIIQELEGEEDSSSDSDFDVDKYVEKELAVEDESAEEEEEDTDAESEADEEEDGEGEAEEEVDEDEASSLSEEESEEETTESKPKVNGIPKPNATPKQKIKQEHQIKQEKKTPKGQPIKQEPKEKQQKQKVLKGGVIVQDIRDGIGEVVKSGKFVHVYYEGRLKDNNKVFDSTTKGPGFSFRVGKGEVIKGWDIGLAGMKAGGKRRIICPPNVAYGPKGSPPVIPPNATLVFVVELKKVS